MTFRQATTEDIPELVKCRIRQLIDEGQEPGKDIQAENAEYFREYMENGQLEEWICEEKGSIIATGAIIYYRFPPSFINRGGLKGYITNIYTEPEYRGHGIATQMLHILEDRMREKGVCRIWLEASKWGKPVYEKYGFKENDTILMIET